MSMRERIGEWPDSKLQQTLLFFDCDKLRRSYTGLIADLRSEIKRRATAPSPTTSPAKVPANPNPADTLANRVDALADERERRRFSPLGVGYYTAEVRREAKAVAASMLAAAAAHGITLGVLDMVTDLAAAALDAASISHARARFLGGA